jgi:hypothetical protein
MRQSRIYPRTLSLQNRYSMTKNKIWSFNKNLFRESDQMKVKGRSRQQEHLASVFKEIKWIGKKHKGRNKYLQLNIRQLDKRNDKYMLKCF